MNKTDMWLTPKFLTPTVAELALNYVKQSLAGMSELKRSGFHIVILVPTMNVAGAYPNYVLEAHILYEASVNEQTWSPGARYQEIARCKALQLWHGRNVGGTDILPHLLFPDDTPFWGGVKRDGIVVACSGVQPHFDRMIAGVLADTCIALAYDAWLKSEDRVRHIDFLS